MKHNKYIFFVSNNMNFTIHENNFTIDNVLLMDSKKNIIMDGSFTKMNYLSQYLTMNGLFFYINIDLKNRNSIEKQYIHYDPYTEYNLPIIQFLSNIETELLNYYLSSKQKNKKKNTLFSKQLYTGYLKVTQDGNIDRLSVKKRLVVKISGIWETTEEIGITYKIFEGGLITL